MMKIPGFKNLVDILWKGFTINRLPGQPDTSLSSTARSGVSVTEENALKATAVWACVRLLSETIASLPFFVYKRLEPRGKERASEHSLYRLLHDIPNKEMTSFQLRETMMAHLLTWGNAYAFKEYDIERLEIKAIWPMNPSKMKVIRNQVTKEIEYHYPLNTPGISDIIPAYRIWHIPGLGFDGLVGYSPLTMAREAIGLSLATEEFGARFFGQGMNTGMIGTYPGKLSDDRRKELKKEMQEKLAGLGKAHEMMLLEDGWKFEKTTIPPNDAQFLETRKFQRAEIASFFHVPPHMIGDLERATFSNIEEQALEFVIYTMRPWLVRWEQSIFRNLLMPWEQDEYFAEFLVDGLLRGNIESRYRAYAIGRNWGWYNADEIRELENMNPLPDGQGQIYMAPQNMIPADKFNEMMPKPPDKPKT